MQSVDANLLGLLDGILGSQHGGVGGVLVSVSLDLHAAGDSGNGLSAGQIGDVDESIVEGCKDSGNAENELSLSSLGTEGNVV